MFEELGLSLSVAVIIFLKAVVRERGMPFSMNNKPDDTVETK